VNCQEIRLPSAAGEIPLRVFQPDALPRAGVIFYMDAFGWRNEIDAMCARYAKHGYVCYLPDLYWRLGVLRFRPQRARDEPLPAAMDAANSATTVEMSIADTGAILAYARSNGVRRLGTVGHCMGARHALGALATYPEMIGAAASLHGGRMVWNGPNSPHLYIVRAQGPIYLAFAADDPTCPDAHKALFEETARQARVPVETENFLAAHGWTFPERWCYDPVAAEQVWTKVMRLFASLA
jgi:carboxymethylenebutenolidase